MFNHSKGLPCLSRSHTHTHTQTLSPSPHMCDCLDLFENGFCATWCLFETSRQFEPHRSARYRIWILSFILSALPFYPWLPLVPPGTPLAVFSERVWLPIYHHDAVLRGILHREAANEVETEMSWHFMQVISLNQLRQECLLFSLCIMKPKRARFLSTFIWL